MRIEVAALTNIGKKRSVDEDAVFVLREHEVFAAIDGTGGYVAGVTAARIVASELSAFFSAPGAHRSPFLAPLLEQAIQQANRTVWLASNTKPELRGMGATMAAIQIAGEFVSVAHVGDCRVYRFSNSRLTPVTEDHSLVRDMIRAGKLTQEQAKDFPHKGVVTRAIGVLEEVKVECQSLIPEHGDVFLLCSDGLHGMLDDLKIEAVLKSGSSLDQVAQSLVDAANAAGGNDNIAVVLVRTTWTRLKDGKS